MMMMMILNTAYMGMQTFSRLWDRLLLGSVWHNIPYVRCTYIDTDSIQQLPMLSTLVNKFHSSSLRAILEVCDAPEKGASGSKKV